MYVILAGSPAEGFRVIGPFKQPHYASEWADTWLDSLDWWVLSLEHENDIQEEVQNEGNQ